MAASRSFKVPSMIAQDLAIIIGFVDPPAPPAGFQEKEETVRGHKRKGSPNIVSRSAIDTDTDISSSSTESEDEVEAQIAISLVTDGTAIGKTIPSSIKASSSSDEDSDSSSSESSSSVKSFPRRRTGKQTQTLPSGIEMDVNEDGTSTAATYVPTTHELPPTAIPVPSLPDPSTLPQEALELVGEIVAVLPDSVTVRGGGLANSSARARRDAVLDEGSLLLLDDRTPLGYVWETFGPTTLPHYLVRVKRRDSTQDTTSTSISHTSPDDSLEPHQTVSNTANNPQSTSPSNPPATPFSHDYPDPISIFVSRAIYHIPSLSTFVFPSALAGIKGSDASNIHDEEPAEHEVEFSDDEAEAMHKRRRRGSFSRALSQAPFSGTFDGEGDDSISTVGDAASSLYGASPYDFENISSPNGGKHGVPSSPSDSDSPGPSPSVTNFEDTAVQEALILARNSRHRRHNSMSVSETSYAAAPSRTRDQDHQFHSRGRRGGRGRGSGKDRGRSEHGRERNSRGHARGRGYARSQGVAPEHRDGGHMSNGNQGSSFSFEEYDPHMPRPPSPTSLAIARAIGQWADGTPFPYNSGAASGDNAMGSDRHVGQTTSYRQGRMSMQYPPGPYRTQEYYPPTLALPQTLEYQSLPVGGYGVAPHINPRFAQAFQMPNSPQASSVTAPNIAVPPGSLNTSLSHTQPELSEADPGFRSGD